jgi:hypothetical protein
MTYITTRKEELYKEIDDAFGINMAILLSIDFRSVWWKESVMPFDVSSATFFFRAR